MKMNCEMIQRIRKDRSCSIQEAHRIATKIQLLKDAEKAITIEQLQLVLIRLLKLSIIVICLSLCISCASKTKVKPEEVNDYLIKITERSNFDLHPDHYEDSRES